MMQRPLPAELAQRRLAAAALGGLVLVLLALAGRLIHIQTTMGTRLTAAAHEQRQSRSVLPARRGRILDTRGRVLAMSRTVPDVFLDPARAEDIEQLADGLAPRLNTSPESILGAVDRRPDSRYIVLARAVDEVTAAAVKSMRDPAVGLTNRVQRVYPLGTSLAHVLGFVGRDGSGLEGTELEFHEHLAGQDGRLGSIRDARRRALGRSAEESRDPVDGGDVVLTIDAEVQRIAEKALRGAVERFDARSGVAVVMVPGTGDILAMANWPGFDPSRPADVPPEVRRNRVVTDPVEPGSTFKPFIACGALAGGFVTTSERINCRNGQHYFGSRLVQDSHPCGMLDLVGIITQSSNIGMATIGTRMGNSALHDTIRRFGFGRPTGIRYPGESAGVVRPLRKWDGFSAVSVSFGYEITVTPLQLITAFCTLVTDGTPVQPRLVRRLLDARGRLVASRETPVRRERAASERIARYITQEGLVSVVENGSVKRVMKGPHRVLGKTGTAKLLNPDTKRYEPGAYLATFVGAAPARNPRIVVLVMVRRPDARKGYYGAVVAAPAVAEILRGTLAYLEVPPEELVASMAPAVD